MTSRTLTRRDVLAMLGAAGVAASAGGLVAAAAGRRRAPAWFISHGAPTAAIEDDAYSAALTAAGRGSAPRALVVVSAHWQTAAGARVTTSAAPETIHDFGGFPDAMYQLRYPAPGDPALANDIIERLRRADIPAEPDATRGLDHGTWVPLLRTHAAARTPVIQVSLPRRRFPRDLLRMGAALAPLREDGVLLIGSGGVVHNLGMVAFGDKQATPVDWAWAFDTWVAEQLERFDVPALVDYAKSAPSARLAVPTTEHFDPIFVVLGAALDGDELRSLYEGFQYGTLSLRSFALA